MSTWYLSVGIGLGLFVAIFTAAYLTGYLQGLREPEFWMYPAFAFVVVCAYAVTVVAWPFMMTTGVLAFLMRWTVGRRDS